MNRPVSACLLTSALNKGAGGLFATIHNLSIALQRSGVNVSILACDFDPVVEHELMEIGVICRRYHRWNLPVLKTLGFSTDIFRQIESLNPDIVHVQGIWMWHSMAALRYGRRHPASRILVEPHGMLDPWAVTRSHWKKAIVGHLFEFSNLRRAHCLHALCRSEEESIRKFGLTNPVEIIPNGVTLPDIPIEEILNRRSNRGEAKRTLLYLGRIHPKKGLSELVEALNILKEQNSPFLKEWEVKVAGWNQGGYAEQLQARIDGCGLNDVVTLVGPLFGDSKEQAYIDADAFILPSFSEGLPMTILEAWAYGLPTIQTEFCNLPEGFTVDAAVQIAPDAESIAQGLNRLTSLPYSTLSEMGLRGRSLVERKFTWTEVADRTKELYEHLISK